MSLKVENLQFRYKKNLVLDGIAFEASAPEVISVLGKNGAGKSTLFKCILGLLDFQNGTIEISGQNMKTLSKQELAKRVSYVPQSHDAAFPFTALEIVLMGTTAGVRGFTSPGKKEKEIAENALEIVGIPELLHRRFSQLSGGEKQLVYIARAIAQQADIMLMDEPCSSLDYGNQVRILRKIRELAETGLLILLSTHNPDHALSYADKALLLSNGKLLGYGPVNGVLSAENIGEIYNLQVDILTLGSGRNICIPKNR